MSASRPSSPLPTPPCSTLSSSRPSSLERATSGLINPTWYARTRAAPTLVLQRLNPIFPAE